MYLRTLEICVLKYMSLISSSSWISMVKVDLLTEIDMLLMVEKGIRGGICHSIAMQNLIAIK